MKLKKTLASWKKSFDKPRQHIEKQRHCFVDKCPYRQSSGFSSSQLWMWELDHKEGWTLKNWCFSTVVVEKTLQSPLDCKEIKPVYSKGNQFWIFIVKTVAEGEAPVFWLPNVKSQLIGKDPDAWKNWGQEEKRVGKDEMVVWHHWLNGHEFEETLGGSGGQRSLACYRLWDQIQTWPRHWTTTTAVVTMVSK